MDHPRLERLLTALHASEAGLTILQRICVVSSTSTGCDGAGMSRIVDGRHEVLVASDDVAHTVEVLQVDLEEGPCMEVLESQQPSLEPDLASARARDRWPRFAPRAAANGVAAVYAFPLIVGGVTSGVLDMYSRRSGDLGSEAVSDALLLADLAVLAVERVDDLAAIPEVGLSTEPVAPWAHAAVVHNATGVVSEQLRIGVDEAMLRLRAVAFMTERPLAAVARDVVERRLHLESWSERG